MHKFLQGQSASFNTCCQCLTMTRIKNWLGRSTNITPAYEKSAVQTRCCCCCRIHKKTLAAETLLLLQLHNNKTLLAAVSQTKLVLLHV
jgi:hypothetical protein